jgi:hypothetical protein
MLYDSFGRKIRKPHLYGFARVPAVEPSRRIPKDDLCDAIGFAEIHAEEAQEDDKPQEIPHAF